MEINENILNKALSIEVLSDFKTYCNYQQNCCKCSLQGLIEDSYDQQCEVTYELVRIIHRYNDKSQKKEGWRGSL